MKRKLPVILALSMLLTTSLNLINAQCISLSTPADGEILCGYDEVTLTATPGFDNYQWYYNFSDSNVGGNLYTEGGNSITLPAGEWAVSYWYVETDDVQCTEASNTVWWDSWLFLPPAIAHDPNDFFCFGDSVMISSAFGGPVFFQWYINFVPIEGATSPVYWVTQPGFYTLSVAYEECPELWLSSGVGPEFFWYPPQTLEISTEDTNEGVLLSIPGGANPQWFFNGDSIQGANGLTLLAEVNGVYTATITDENGCTVTSNEVVVTVTSAPIWTLNDAAVYPNPFRTSLTIESPPGRVASVRVIDLAGKQVFATSSALPGKKVINLSHLPSGLYFVELTSTEGERHTMKMVKQ